MKPKIKYRKIWLTYREEVVLISALIVAGGFATFIYLMSNH
jgi:hypothetical protein